MPTEIAAAPITINTPSTPIHDEQYWQVFFLPKDDPAVPTSFIAFCPYTGVCAEGNTEAEAGIKWKEEARRQFNRYFYLPDLHTSRKVWYGEAGTNGTNTNTNTNLPLSLPLQQPSPSPLNAPASPRSFYVIDNFGETDQAIAFSPQSKDVIVGKGVEELSEVDNLPHFWSDWRVSCTPLLHRNWFFSLTPHCINW